jgi:hypothetical protein
MVIIIDENDNTYALAKITSKAKKPFRFPISGFKKQSYVDRTLYIKGSNGKPITYSDFEGKTTNIIKDNERSKVWNHIFKAKTNRSKYNNWKNKKKKKN